MNEWIKYLLFLDKQIKPVCVFVCVCVYVYVCVCLCVYVYVYMRVRMRGCKLGKLRLILWKNK